MVTEIDARFVIEGWLGPSLLEDQFFSMRPTDATQTGKEQPGDRL